MTPEDLQKQNLDHGSPERRQKMIEILGSKGAFDSINSQKQVDSGETYTEIQQKNEGNRYKANSVLKKSHGAQRALSNQDEPDVPPRVVMTKETDLYYQMVASRSGQTTEDRREKK